MKKFAVGVVLLAALGAACAKAGSDGPVPDANENAMKAASAAAAESYVGSLEQLAVGSIRASSKAAADAYVESLQQNLTAIPSPETITTVGTVLKEKYVDVGKKGPSVGDTFAATLDIKSQAGVDLGTERTQCTLGTGRWGICTGAFDITGRGEIVGTGTVNLGSDLSDFDVPITGGTGAFANVRGVAHVHITETGENDTLELLP